VRLFCALVIAFLAIGGRDLRAQELKLYSEILPDGAAAVGPDWAELLFPPVELSNTGCAHTNAFPPHREPMRGYYWGAQTRFVDAFTGPTDHYTALGVGFALPDRVPITDARLDSALAVADLRVTEDKGEPPGPIDIVTPRRAWARREGRRVRIRIEGKEAVAALLRPRGDSIDLRWCRREEAYVFPSRTRIVGGSGIAPKVPHYSAADSAAAFAAVVDAILTEDSSASNGKPRDPMGLWPRDPEPLVFVRIVGMPDDAWAAPSVERMRKWRWRMVGMAVDSTDALIKRADSASRRSRTAVPLEIAMSFYMPTDTAEVTEYRMFRTCGVRPGDRFAIWWVKRLLTSTSSRWRQIDSRSGMAQGACN
jgi:hypothetical protein